MIRRLIAPLARIYATTRLTFARVLALRPKNLRHRMLYGRTRARQALASIVRQEGPELGPELGPLFPW
ncbi:hypothetical protein JYU09_01145 [bacterium AH-315-O15]|nr:hypothetical protein [bacterium AH-315-O15]